MNSRYSKYTAVAATLVALGAVGCRGSASGTACGSASATPIARDPAAVADAPGRASAPTAAPDPTAPVLAPGEHRPSLRSAAFADLDGMLDVASFAEPSAERPQGSLLVAMTPGGGQPARLVEIDLVSLKPVRERRLPLGGYGIRVAASEAGAVVVLHDIAGGERTHDAVFVLGPTLETEKTIQVEGHGTSVAVDGTHAVYAAAEWTGTNQLVALEVPGGKIRGRRSVRGELVDEWVPTVQVVAKHERVWLLIRGRKHYELEAFSNDLSKLEGRAQMSGSEVVTDGIPDRHYGDGLLAPSKTGVVVVRDGSMEEYGTSLTGSLPMSYPGAPVIPAMDDATGRFLLPTGHAAAGFGDKELNPVVVFRRGVWRWSSDGEVPLGYDEPVAAFFVGGRGVIVTRHPGLRVSVLDWSSVPAAAGPTAP